MSAGRTIGGKVHRVARCLYDSVRYSRSSAFHEQDDDDNDVDDDGLRSESETDEFGQDTASSEETSRRTRVQKRLSGFALQPNLYLDDLFEKLNLPRRGSSHGSTRKTRASEPQHRDAGNPPVPYGIDESELDDAAAAAEDAAAAHAMAATVETLSPRPASVNTVPQQTGHDSAVSSSQPQARSTEPRYTSSSRCHSEAVSSVRSWDLDACSWEHMHLRQVSRCFLSWQ